MPKLTHRGSWACRFCEFEGYTNNATVEHELRCFSSTADKPDLVTQPAHYNQGDVECIDAIASALGPEAFKGYLHGNSIKYLWRHRYKGNEVQDLEKATWYINKLKEQYENQRIPGTSVQQQTRTSGEEAGRAGEDQSTTGCGEPEIPCTD